MYEQETISFWERLLDDARRLYREDPTKERMKKIHRLQHKVIRKRQQLSN